ncbi:MAG: hypothetical protein LBV12_02600, partial [Puniceicoccales bacterium]|nr:hypothetical protein [Puniceicoccales bacterium]
MVSFAALIGAATSTLHAITWTGQPGESDPVKYWNDPANWDTQRPTKTDTAIVNNGFRATVNSADAQAAILRIYNDR